MPRISSFSSFVVALGLVVALGSVAEAGTLKVEGKPKATFFAVGSPSFLNIEGTTTALQVADDGAKLTFTVPMSTVDSGVELRDQHMRDNYVQVAKFPNATIQLNKADIPWPAAGAKDAKGTVNGTFEVHGVTQPAAIQYQISKTGTGYRVKAKFNYDCNQHGIFIEDYMGVTIDPKMYAVVNVDLADVP
jgi:polyisoprenoid-binding protein YceI